MSLILYDLPGLKTESVDKPHALCELLPHIVFYYSLLSTNTVTKKPAIRQPPSYFLAKRTKNPKIGRLGLFNTEKLA